MIDKVQYIYHGALYYGDSTNMAPNNFRALFIVVIVVIVCLCEAYALQIPKDEVSMEVKVTKQWCSTTTYCNDGYRCCTKYTCCPTSRLCCGGGQYCCARSNEFMEQLTMKSVAARRVTNE